MRVAVAGSGDLARYLCDELPKQGHQVVILSRSQKAQFDGRPGIQQRVTDYSAQSLLACISDCRALVSTILDYSSSFIDVHKNLIQACVESPHCKRFIPSEYGGNIADFPDQPAFYYHTREPIREILRNQHELQWTLICVGWLVDYLVPARNRYFKDIGEAFPVDLNSGNIVIPGDGTNPVDLTWGRDVAKGIAALLNAPEWEPYIYMSGQQTCWNDVAIVIKHRHPNLAIHHKSLSALKEVATTSADAEAALIAEYQIFSAGNASFFPSGRVAAHKEKYFSGMNFRTMAQGLKELDDSPDIIL